MAYLACFYKRQNNNEEWNSNNYVLVKTPEVPGVISGFGGTNLQLLYSYLSNRTLSVVVSNSTSSSAQLSWRSLFFNNYLLLLVMSYANNIIFHCHADDTQFYLQLITSDPNCLSSLKAWYSILDVIKHSTAKNYNKNKSFFFVPSVLILPILHSSGLLTGN